MWQQFLWPWASSAHGLLTQSAAELTTFTEAAV